MGSEDSFPPSWSPNSWKSQGNSEDERTSQDIPSKAHLVKASTCHQTKPKIRGTFFVAARIYEALSGVGFRV